MATVSRTLHAIGRASEAFGRISTSMGNVAIMAKITIGPGQRFHARDFPKVLWEVTKVYEGTDGIAYAQLRNVDDASRLKTVAISALKQRSLWGHVTSNVPTRD